MKLSLVFNLFLLLFLGLADNQMIPALLPVLGRSLGTSIAVTGLLVVFYSLSAALAAFVIGSLSDHYGRSRFLQAGAFLFAAASFAAWLSPSFGALAVARAVTGFAAGTLSTCTIAFAGDWFPYEVRGKAIGWISSSYFVAPLTVPLAGLVAEHLGWPRVFLGFGALALVIALVARRLPRDRGSARHSESKLGATLAAFRSFLGRRDTAAMLLAAFLVSGGLVGFLTYIGEWLHARFALTTAQIGLVFMMGGLVAVIGAPLGGVLADRWNKRQVSIASNVLIAASVFGVPFLGWGLPLLGVICGASLGAGLRQGPLTALMTEMVPQAQRGSFVALRNICSQLGIGSAVFAGGLLYQRRGYSAVALLCALMTALVALLLVAYIPEPVSASERV
jgi:predicted MFS family arabinose efflux permease